MRNQQGSTSVRKPSWSDKIPSGNTNQIGETVTLTKAELRSLLDAAIGQNPSPSGIIDFYNDCAYDVKNEDGDESGYPASLDASPAPDSGLQASFNSHSSVNLKMESDMTQSFPPPSIQSTCSSSKLEAKRRQWEREKEERLEWDPWGRPGGGAPRQRSQSLNQVPVTSSNSLPYGGRMAVMSSQTRSIYQRDPSKYSMRSFADTAISSHRVPEYLKSSLPFGPNSTDGKNELWGRDDLSHQNYRNDALSDTWYDQQCNSTTDLPRHTSYSGPITPLEGSTSHARGQGVFETDSGRVEKLQKAMEYRRFIEAQMEEKRRKQQEDRERKKKDEEEEERKLDEDRKLMQKQFDDEQRKIKEKEELVERKRVVLLEAVKNAEESAEAEKRAKRAHRRNQGKALESQNVDSPTHSVVSSSISKSQMTPIKAIKKLEKPEYISNNTSYTHHSEDEEVILSQDLSSLQAWITDETKPPISNPSPESNPARSQQMATVYPIQSQPTKLQDNASPNSKLTKEFGIQTEPSLSPYIQNRLLTPSQWRIKERLNRHNHIAGGTAPVNVWGCCRDMSSQTESYQPSEWKVPSLHSRRKTEHSDYAIGSSSSSTCSSAAKDRNNSKQNAKQPEQRSESETLPSQSGTDNKPKWGVNKPSKNFIKMTERDPNCRRRKKLQEMRKQHWEKELATQKAMSQTKKMLMGAKNGPDIDKTQKHHGSNKEEFSLGSTYTVSHGQKIYARVPPVQTGVDKNENSILVLPPLSGRWSRSSDSLPNVVFKEDTRDTTHAPSYGSKNNLRDMSHNGSRVFEQPVRRKWHSQENFLPTPHSAPQELQNGYSIAYTANHEPSLGHFPLVNDNEVLSDGYDDRYEVEEVAPTPRRKWSEQANFDLEKMTLLQAVFANKEIDRPSDLDSTSLKTSPKNSGVDSRNIMTSKHPPIRRESSDDRDPLVNPNVVMERPTPRQDKILQQLSSLRRGLLMKQQEIENRLQKTEAQLEI